MIQRSSRPEVDYPSSDGEPMAENTLQFEWIVTIKGNLDIAYQDVADVFIAGDLLWYPLQGNNRIRTAPDIFAVFGRPKGYRGSYRQWEEGGIAPQVAFEILSPGNRSGKMQEKFQFYEKYGVEEYYVYDPEFETMEGWKRDGPRLCEMPTMDGHVSPRLGVRFACLDSRWHFYRPDGHEFASFTQIDKERQEATSRADLERRAKEQAQQRADQERLAKEQAQQRADQERLAKEQALQEAERLALQLKELGIDPKKI